MKPTACPRPTKNSQLPTRTLPGQESAVHRGIRDSSVMERLLPKQPPVRSRSKSPRIWFSTRVTRGSEMPEA